MYLYDNSICGRANEYIELFLDEILGDYIRKLDGM